MHFKNRFKCEASLSCSAYKDHPLQINYATSEGSGYIVKDQVVIGGQIVLQDMHFLVLNQTTQLDSFVADGILGLGYTHPD